MKTIDFHEGPGHRIDRPTRCPQCAAGKTGSKTVERDDMALDIEFGCGAAVRWRSVLVGGDHVYQWYESVSKVRTCPADSSKRLGLAVVAGWGFSKIRPPRGSDRGCVWVQAPGEDGWRAMTGDGGGWLSEALDEAGVPE